MLEITGILLLNKPHGLSSHRALKKVKRLLDVDKAGHTGTLDPLATGMLPICIGETTKFSQFLLDADKAYRTVMKLGTTTASGDAEGDILRCAPIPDFTETNLQVILKQFTGVIDQIPPMYSALKHEGKRLYKLANKGMIIDRPARAVTIRELTLIDYTADTITLDVVCSKGTYIRTLVEDIGAALGCGAHVAALHRYYCAPFITHPIYDLDALNAMTTEELKQLILPIDAALLHFPAHDVSTEHAIRLLQGQRVRLVNQGAIPVARFTHHELGFLGLGEITADGLIRPRRMMSPQRISSMRKPT